MAFGGAIGPIDIIREWTLVVSTTPVARRGGSMTAASNVITIASAAEKKAVHPAGAVRAPAIVEVSPVLADASPATDMPE